MTRLDVQDLSILDKALAHSPTRFCSQADPCWCQIWIRKYLWLRRGSAKYFVNTLHLLLISALAPCQVSDPCVEDHLPEGTVWSLPKKQIFWLPVCEQCEFPQEKRRRRSRRSERTRIARGEGQTIQNYPKQIFKPRMRLIAFEQYSETSKLNTEWSDILFQIARIFRTKHFLVEFACTAFQLGAAKCNHTETYCPFENL